jgi:putative hemolysin
MEDPEGPMGLIPRIIIPLLIILGAGFFSFLKTALACCRKPRLRLLAEGGEKKYEAVLLALEKAGFFLASLRIMIIFLEMLAGGLGVLLLLKFPAEFFRSLGLGSWAVFLGVFFLTLLFTAVLFLLGEAVPRRAGRGIPERAAAFFLPFIKFVSFIAAPLLLADRVISAGAKKIFPAGPGHTGMTEDELRIALLEGEKSGIVESEERTMVEGVFYLGDRPAGAFMTHRSEVRWLDIDAGSEEACLTAGAGRDQRYFPVADGELDKVSGAVAAEDILKALLPQGPSTAPLPWPGLKALMKPPYFVPETMPAIKAFEAFKKADADYLFVMDEYGGFAGILTVRNLIEEIVGQLSASKTEGEEILPQEDGSWLADGSVNIDDAARALSLSGLGGEHGDYHTLAGFILDLAGEIPKTGARFDYHGYRFKIVDMDGNRIDKVMISRPQKPEPPSGA